MVAKALLTLLALLVLPAAAWGQIQANVGESTVRVEGVTKGGKVALLSVWREQLLGGPHASQTNIEETLTDDDQDGIVTYEADRTIPPISLWVAVDVTTGEAAIVSPPEFKVRHMSGREVADFRAARVHVKRRELQVLVVRPGVASWRGRAHDGDVGDTDHVPDQSVALSLDDLDGPREDAPAFRAGDTVIAIDPVEMDVLAVRLN